MIGSCATAGCKTQHLHPVTGEPPDYHFIIGGPYEPRPRWKNPYKGLPNPKDWWYSIAEVAKMIGRHPTTVREYVRQGLLQAYKPTRTKGGHWYIRGTAVDAFIRSQGSVAPLPAEASGG